MYLPSILVAAAAGTTAPQPGIIVTASRLPVAAESSPASSTVFDQDRIEALGAVFLADLIRLSPGVSVSSSGGPGSLTQIRLRGAEANHSLLFVDGIAFNDLAAGNEPRFEAIAATGLGRVEIVRGPQSALWGSEALGGVIAVETPAPANGTRASASGEYGNRDSARLAGAFSTGGQGGGLAATAAWSRSDGIDVLGGGTGDRDGFENLTLSLKGIVRPAAAVEAGAVARYVRHHNEYDGTDAFFRRADTPEESFADTWAARGWLSLGAGEASPWSLSLDAEHLDSRNRNWNGKVHTNDSYGRRTRLGAQAGRVFTLAGNPQRLIAAAEWTAEDFGTRDRQFGGASDRDLSRGRTAFVAEWRGAWGDRVTTDVAVRRDLFSRFRDATTLRAAATIKLTQKLQAVASYGEGIAQPTFFDLFGFAPNSGFVANPALKPERSRGVEGGLRWNGRRLSTALVGFSSALRDEIVEDFSLFPHYTVVNAPGRSRRRGLEASADWRPRDGLRIGANYTYVDTRERRGAAAAALREIRRPKHSANLYGDWRSGPVTVGASLAYVGPRIDSDFDLFPAPRVRLGRYVLGSAQVAYRLGANLEAYVRTENAFDARYQDVVGYRTAGRSLYAGLRVRLGD